MNLLLLPDRLWMVQSLFSHIWPFTHLKKKTCWPNHSASATWFVQVFLRQCETMWQSPPPWPRAGSPISSSGKVGPNPVSRSPLPMPTSAPTATWVRERKRLASLQVPWPLTRGCVWCQFSRSIASWAASTFCHLHNPLKRPYVSVEPHRRTTHSDDSSWQQMVANETRGEITSRPTDNTAALLFGCDSSSISEGWWRVDGRERGVVLDGLGIKEGFIFTAFLPSPYVELTEFLLLFFSLSFQVIANVSLKIVTSFVTSA